MGALRPVTRAGLPVPIGLAIALLFARVAEAQIYSWVDANGTVNFSQSPPPEALERGLRVVAWDEPRTPLVRGGPERVVSKADEPLPDGYAPDDEEDEPFDEPLPVEAGGNLIVVNQAPGVDFVRSWLTSPVPHQDRGRSSDAKARGPGFRHDFGPPVGTMPRKAGRKFQSSRFAGRRAHGAAPGEGPPSRFARRAVGGGHPKLAGHPGGRGVRRGVWAGGGRGARGGPRPFLSPDR
jgi:hypothetical protein